MGGVMGWKEPGVPSLQGLPLLGSVRAEHWDRVGVLQGALTHLGIHKGVPEGSMPELSAEGGSRR